jgi:peptide/nickel transport system permease protein
MTMALPVLLWSDAVVLLLAVLLCLAAWRVRRDPARRADWLKVFRQPAPLCSALVLAAFLGLAVADSLHFRRALPAAGATGAAQAYATQVESVLDVMLAPLVQGREVSYSAPLAARAFAKATQGTERTHPRLLHGGVHLADDATERVPDVALRVAGGLLAGALVAAVLALGLGRLALGTAGWRRAWRGESVVPWGAALATVVGLGALAGGIVSLAPHYHVLGTDRTGNDVLYQALKSVRTAFVIGTLSTLATLPLAVGLGIVAGYFRGWVDEAVQYTYTVLSSIPNVLLIAACVLMMQVFIDTHPDLFETGAERADLRLFLLCVILGLTGWAGLCRLLRAETLKLRELDYVQAATAFGVGPWRIMARHVFPNVVHLVVITTVLDFSALVLYEAVLSYVGVGVDPTMNSFGGMINLARSEMSRDPVVWWSFAAAFGFMVGLVLVANLFADGVRDAFDPGARAFRARLPAPPREAA